MATSNPGITVSGVSVASATGITAAFAISANAAAGAANVTVTTAGRTSAPVAFTVTAVPPDVSSMWPLSGPAVISVTITGAQFGASQGGSTVTFGGVSAGVASAWSDSSITALVPSGAATGNVVVTVDGQASNGIAFTVTIPPAITNIWPMSGPVATVVTITGSNFGAASGSHSLTFGGVNAIAVPYWNDTSITTVVPAGAATGAVVVTVNNMASGGVPYTVTSPPAITGVTPTRAAPGVNVAIDGTGFGAEQASGWYGWAARMARWSVGATRRWWPRWRRIRGPA